MIPHRAARSSGLDISLLGVILAGIGVTLNYVSGASGSVPHLIRFFDVSPDRSYPAMMPQDAALLLLSDPSTRPAEPTTAGAPLVSFGDLPLVLVVVGLVLVVGGPVWSWYYR